jgi:hypothetical protein
MKATLISMVIVLCVLATVPLFMFGDRGMLARFGIDLAGESEMRAKTPKNLTQVTTDQKVQVYRWRDEYGVMQFTNTPPPAGLQAEIIELTPNTNIVKAVEVPAENDEQQGSGPKVMSTGNPYTPGGMMDMLEATAGVKDGMDEKQLEQQQLIEQIMGGQR